MLLISKMRLGCAFSLYLQQHFCLSMHLPETLRHKTNGRERREKALYFYEIQCLFKRCAGLNRSAVRC